MFCHIFHVVGQKKLPLLSLVAYPLMLTRVMKPRSQCLMQQLILQHHRLFIDTSEAESYTSSLASFIENKNGGCPKPTKPTMEELVQALPILRRKRFSGRYTQRFASSCSTDHCGDLPSRQDSQNGHTAGNAIYAAQKAPFYVFLISNTLALSNAIFIIISLTIKFPFQLEVVVATVSMIVTYGSAVFAVAPKEAVNFSYVLIAAAVPVILRFLKNHL